MKTLIVLLTLIIPNLVFGQFLTEAVKNKIVQETEKFNTSKRQMDELQARVDSLYVEMTQAQVEIEKYEALLSDAEQYDEDIKEKNKVKPKPVEVIAPELDVEGTLRNFGD